MRLDIATFMFKVFFWLSIANVLLYITELSIYDYPRTTTSARGWTIAKLVSSVIGVFLYPYIMGWL